MRIAPVAAITVTVIVLVGCTASHSHLHVGIVDACFVLSDRPVTTVARADHDGRDRRRQYGDRISDRRSTSAASSAAPSGCATAQLSLSLDRRLGRRRAQLQHVQPQEHRRRALPAGPAERHLRQLGRRDRQARRSCRARRPALLLQRGRDGDPHGLGQRPAARPPRRPSWSPPCAGSANAARRCRHLSGLFARGDPARRRLSGSIGRAPPGDLVPSPA